MEQTVLNWLNDPMVRKIVTAAVVLIVILLIAGIGKRSVTRYVRVSDTRYRLRKFITFGSYLLIAFVLSVIFSDRLGGLTVAFGVAGAGVAFALQEVITSFAGWFAIVFAGFYKSGDRVELGGIKGDVIDISFLRTTVMEVGEWVKGDLYTGRIVRVANSFVFKAPVFNYSGDFPFLWDEITVPVKYGSDQRLARAILTQIAHDVVGDYVDQAREAWMGFSKHFLLEDAETGSVVSLVANDNWAEYTVRYVVDFKRRRSTKDEMFTRIIDAFEKSNDKVSFASATFEVVGVPTIEVKTKQE